MVKAPKGPILIGSDFHVPHHDERAVAAFRAVARDVHPRVLVILGDFGDWGAFSHFPKERPEIEQMLDSEAAPQRKLLAQLRGDVGDKCRIVYVRGNHEVRPHSWCMAHAPQLSSAFGIPRLLQLEDLGIEWSDRAVRFGSLLAIHGHETMRGWGSKHHAAIMAHKFGHVVYGHTHKPQSFVDETADGGARMALALGCLSLLRPGYTGGPDAPNGWRHGFALADVPDRGAPWVAPVYVNAGTAAIPGLGRFAG